MLDFVASLFLFLFIVTVALVLFRTRLGRGGQEARIRALRPEEGSVTPAVEASRRRSTSSIPTLRALLRRSEWAEETATELERAHIHLLVGEYLLVRLLLGGVLFLVPAVILRFHPLSILLGLATGAIGFLIPAFYVKFVQQRRVSQIEKQLIDFLPMLASSLRAGFAFQQGVESAVEQLRAPISEELALLLNDVNLGATMQDALLDMGRRVGSPDLDMVVTAVLVQRTTGGNLSEILDHVAETLRERERIRGEIMTFTAQQRLAGAILSVWPIGIAALLLVIMPEQWSKLFTDTLGRVLLSVALGLQLLGFIFIRRVLRIEI